MNSRAAQAQIKPKGFFQKIGEFLGVSESPTRKAPTNNLDRFARKTPYGVAVERGLSSIVHRGGGPQRKLVSDAQTSAYLDSVIKGHI